MNELALFAGAGGGILGGKLLGWRTVCAVELDEYAASVLVARQNDGSLEPFPIWDDIKTFDGRPWRGVVDVVSGGFPCTDISCAGKGAGITGEESGLWKEMARIVGEVRPRYVFVENSPMLICRGLGVVIADLSALGYSSTWGIVGAHHVGAPHRRDRIWILANADGEAVRNEQVGVCRRKGQAWLGDDGAAQSLADTESQRRREEGQFRLGESKERFASGGKKVANSNGTRCEGYGNSSIGRDEKIPMFSVSSRWPVEPDVCRVASGIPSRVDRLKCLGNAQVPAQMARAFQILKGLL